MTRVELFEQIRRDRKLRGKSIRETARRWRVHRRTVRQALESAVPPLRKAPQREPPILTRALRGVIDEWLRADRDAPRKQRHTARRIFQRLVREHGYPGAESTVRGYVGRRRRELGASSQAFVPQTHVPGEEAEADWYEADVDFPEGRRRAFLLQVRACCSGREFHVAFPRMTQQAFLEGLVGAFGYFGGVFAVVRLDNLGAAVKKVLCGRRREETERFVALRSHYLFEAEFCRPGKEGAHEKGGVEGSVGRFRRTHLVPVPKVADFDELNARLRQWCAQDDQRRIAGRQHRVIEHWEQEQQALRELPAEAFDTAEVTTCRVDTKSRVQVRTNRYSVPVRLVGRKVEVRVHARRIVVVHEGQAVAAHERLPGRHGQRLELDHYLELLRYKPGALRRASALWQARQEGRWPERYDQLWTELKQRYGEADGTRQLLDVLWLHRTAPSEAVHRAVGTALEVGAVDAGAIAVLLRQQQGSEAVAEPLRGLGPWDRYTRTANADLSAYDAVIRAGQATP